MERTAQSALVDVALSTNRRKGGICGQTYLHCRSTERKKHLSWAHTTKFQQNISNLVIQMKKKNIRKQLLTLKRLHA